MAKEYGWVKIHRSILMGGFSPTQFKFLVGSILLANTKSSARPGYVPLTIRQLARELDMSTTEVHRCLHTLAKRETITLEQHGFTIINYLNYQGLSVPPVEQKRSARGTPAVPPTEHFVPPTEHLVPPVEQSVPKRVPNRGYKNLGEESLVKNIGEEGEQPPKSKHGEFKNVALTDGEFQKLGVAFGDAGRKERIERLSGYIASTGKKYQSHYATILNWERRDGSGKVTAFGQRPANGIATEGENEKHMKEMFNQ